MTSTKIPKKLAFYYNWVTGANADHTVDGAVAELSKYDIVVLGQVEFPSHGNNADAKLVINHPKMANTKVYGYIDTSNNIYDLVEHIQLWKDMGKMEGIFCDRFGYDYPLYSLEDIEYKYSSGKTVMINRTHQNLLVREIHLQGFKAFVNAWNQEDIFAVEPGTNKKHNLNPDDWSLLESYQVSTGNYVPEKTWRNKQDTVNKYKGQALFAATTTPLDTDANGQTLIEWDATRGEAVYKTSKLPVFDKKKMDYAYVSSILDGLDAFSDGLPHFGSTIPLSPFRVRLEPVPATTSNTLTKNGNVYYIGTTGGISVNVVTHDVSFSM